ncbi:TolB family protein [Terrabacter sp. BE26]|uniref:TolB family protein n=1 Tax=Terrabacter sp. BE26 TaxID=2898152 RepID=UPI0035BE96A7
MTAATAHARALVAAVALATALVVVGCTACHAPSAAPETEAVAPAEATPTQRPPPTSPAPAAGASRPTRTAGPLVARTADVLAVVGRHLRVVHADGSGGRIAVPSVDAPESSVLTLAGDWSPDGRQLTFTRLHHGPEPLRSSLWVADGDGDATREVVRCVNPCQRAGLGSWSPDGDRIAYAVSELGGRARHARSAIEVATLSSGRRHVVAETADRLVELTWPRWSPDGRRLVVQVIRWPRVPASSPRRASPSVRIAVLDLARPRAQTPRVLAPGLPGSHPDWSWRTGVIVFSTNDPHAVDGRADRNLWTVRPDGTGLRRLTHFRPPAAAVHPSWTPDGVVLFEHCVALPACFLAYASADGAVVQTPERLAGRWPRARP